MIGSGLVAGGTEALVWSGIETTLIFMVVSPLVGIVVSFAFCTIIMFICMRKRLETVNNIFGKLQIVSSAFFSLTHGANDGQKTMGIITALLIAGGFLQEAEFKVPFWVVISAAAAIGFGTFLGDGEL